MICHIFDADLIKHGFTIIISESIRVKGAMFMNKLTVKLVSFALTAAVLFSAGACSYNAPVNEGVSGKKVAPEDPWYTAKVTEIIPALDESKQIDYTYNRLVGADENFLVFLTTGYYKMPNGDAIDWSNYDYNSYTIALVTIVDRETGEPTRSFDVTSVLSRDDYLENAFYSKGTVTAICTAYDPNTYEMVSKEFDINVATGVTTANREYSKDDNNGYIDRTFKLGDYRIDIEMVWINDVSSYNLYIYSPDGNERKVEIKDTGEEYYDIPAIFPVGSDTALVPVNTNKGYIYFEIGLNNGRVTSKDAKEYDWIDMENIYLPYIDSEGNAYYTTFTGINKLDFKKKATEELFNYNWCGISRNRLYYLTLVDVSDDSFVLCGDEYTGDSFTVSEAKYSIVKFSKAESNPHAGKTILELYTSYGDTEESVSKAIAKFNETNGDYFIEVTDRYKKRGEDVDYYDIGNDDEYESAELKFSSALSNQLAMDITTGKGPDIIMDVSNLGQLNNDNYLTDLTPYISGLDPDKYFINVIDAAKVDGKLYNLPVSYMVKGIQTDPVFAGSSGVGFTTEEYERFINDTLNGKDSIGMGQAYYFATLFSAMSDKFIVNGKADLDNPEFKELAYYVKENVRENAKSWDEINGDDSYNYYEDIAYYTSCFGFGTYFINMAQYRGAKAILGIPSTDGRGPMVEANVSVAVSAHAFDIDACAEFIKLLLSDEIQTDFAMKDSFVLNREAFRECGMRAVEYYNGEGGDNWFAYDMNTGAPTDHRITFSKTNVDDMENIILSCSSTTSADAAVNLILIEEMPAYFLDQKDLDDVIKIVQDRAQKVLDERG